MAAPGRQADDIPKNSTISVDKNRVKSRKSTMDLLGFNGLLMNPQRRFGNIDQIDSFRCGSQLSEAQGLLDDTVQRLDLLLRQLQVFFDLLRVLSLAQGKKIEIPERFEKISDLVDDFERQVSGCATLIQRRCRTGWRKGHYGTSPSCMAFSARWLFT
jgi:hypothetical protein